MAFTRAQAVTLLTSAEMALYDDSRVNALRKWSSVEIGRRVERARKARDRARDLLQRQKLASRARTGSKRGSSDEANQRSQQKSELLHDILKRFEAQAKVAAQRDKAASRLATGNGKVVSRTGTTPSPGTSKAAATTAPAAPARKTPPARPPANKLPSARAPAKAGKAAKKAPRRITARQALANTHKLLAAKQAHDRGPQPWQNLDAPRDDTHPGYQSEQAAAKAQELHAGESRMTAIHGSISTLDRKNQGKRDGR